MSCVDIIYRASVNGMSVGPGQTLLLSGVQDQMEYPQLGIPAEMGTRPPKNEREEKEREKEEREEWMRLLLPRPLQPLR